MESGISMKLLWSVTFDAHRLFCDPITHQQQFNFFLSLLPAVVRADIRHLLGKLNILMTMMMKSLLISNAIVLSLVGSSSAFAPSWMSSSSGRHASALSATTLDGRTIAGEIKPLNNFLLVKIADAVDQTEGGILLTGSAKIKKTEGTVVSVGPGKTHQDTGVVFDMPVSNGEGVVYGKYDGTEIELDGAKHVLIRDDDILVKFGGGSLSLDTVDTIRDCVLVHVETNEAETEGGILLAQSSSKESRPSTGTVVKVGPGRMAADGSLMDMDVAVGDMIKFRDFAGMEVDIDDKEYSVVRMADILAKF